MVMNEFTLKGKQGFIRIELQEVYGFPESTSHFGGYDARGIAEIKSGNYYVKGQLWFTTGEVYEFYERLNQCYHRLDGETVFSNYESNIKVEIVFTKLGQLVMRGYFKERPDQENELQFEIESEQSYISSTLNQLRNFIDQYGDMKGKSRA